MPYRHAQHRFPRAPTAYDAHTADILVDSFVGHPVFHSGRRMMVPKGSHAAFSLRFRRPANDPPLRSKKPKNWLRALYHQWTLIG